MSVGQILTQRIKEMLGLPPDVRIDPVEGLSQVAQKFLMMHAERVLAHAAFSMLVLMANGPTSQKPEEKPALSDVLGGVAMDFGLYGYSWADIDVVFKPPEQPKVQPVERRLVNLH